MLALLLAAGLAVLYRAPLATGFLNDDHLFLEEASTRALPGSLFDMGALGNYYRPLSRQMWFAALTPLGGGQSLVFHLAQFALFLVALALLADLLLALLPAGAVLLGVVVFALLPLQRVILTWISCDQDLLALTGVLAALALWRRGRTLPAAIAYLGALASKETALPLPAALAAWHLWIERRPARALPARIGPFAALAVGWVGVLLAMRARQPLAAAPLQLGVADFAAGYVHGIQAMLGLDDPPSVLPALLARLPDLAALALLAPLAWWMGTRPPADSEHARPAPAAIAAFALAWIALFALVTGPVSYAWSSYYYLLAAVGGAVLTALACRRITRPGALALVVALAWWHAGATGVRAFAVRDGRWQWTSHLTAFYFERGARLTAELARELRTAEPAPPAGTRFFFLTLPPWAGFQMGNGALVRSLYRDPSLASHFYSTFSESTAAEHPCRFLYWDGDSLRHLYGRAHDPWFQIGGDLLLLDRPQGAMHAFRRGLAAGEDPQDHLYWLGWASLWGGRRDLAESAWKAFGAADDSLSWFTSMRAARSALIDARDTLATRRLLVGAIRSGIGLPDAHAVLGELLMPAQPKYGMLELKVATWLKPGDWMARRGLLLALTDARLDDAARAQLEELERRWDGARRDPQVLHADSLLRQRSGPALDVVRF